MSEFVLRPFPLSERGGFTRTSPEAGDPACVCAFCGLVIGVPEGNPRLDGHDDDACPGCEVCEFPVRLWRGEGEQMEEIRFHGACFQLCVQKVG